MKSFLGRMCRRNPWCFALAVGALTVSSVLGIGLAAMSEEAVVATADGKIVITRADLDRVVNEYRKTSGKSEISRDEKINLVKNLIRRELILQQEDVEAIRKEPAIVEKVKKFEDGLVIVRFLEKSIGARLDSSEEEMQAYYGANRDQFTFPPKVEASHILSRTRDEAQQVLQKLKSGGDFVELAKKHSIDLPMAFEGGKMGTIEKGKTLPELEKVLFSLASGEMSDIVETRFGFHIIRVDQTFAAEPKPYEVVKDEIRKAIMRQKENKAFEEMVSSLEKKTEIKIFEDRLEL